GEPAVELVGGHRDREDDRRRVGVVPEVPGEEDDDDGHREHPGDGELRGKRHAWGEYAADDWTNSRVSTGPRRQPWRDSGEDLPDAARARDRGGGGLLRSGPRQPPRGGRRRRVPDRSGSGLRELSARRRRRRGGAAGGRRGGPPGTQPPLPESPPPRGPP